MRAGHRLPARELHDLRTGKAIPLREPALGSTVLFVLHGAECEPCGAYLATLEELESADRAWDARRLAVVQGFEGRESDLPESISRRGSHRPIPLLPDPGGSLAGHLGLSGSAGLIVADRFGEAFEVIRVQEGHESLPSADAIESWLRFLAIQCPECGVPDSAGYGAWGP